jgi:hypothetical protein
LFFTADGTTTEGAFPEVTLKGDFKIKFKAIASSTAAFRVLLVQAVAGSASHLIGFNASGDLVLRIGSTADTGFGSVTQNKLLSFEIVRSGYDVTAHIDGVQQGTTKQLPGDFILDQVGQNNGGSYFDNVISDLEIIDLDQPDTRDVLTLDGTTSFGGTTAFNPTSGSDLVFEFETDAADTGATQGLYDSRTGGTNGGLITYRSDGVIVAQGLGGCTWSAVAIEVDGIVSTTAPTDGEMHTVKVGLTQTGASANPVFIGSKHDGTDHLSGALLDVKLHDLTTPSNSRRYRMDVESNTTIVNDYDAGTDDLTLNNVVSSDWETMTRDRDTGSWVGPVTTIADSNYTIPVNILWRLDSGSTVSEASARGGGEVLTFSFVVAGDWEQFTLVGADWLAGGLVVNGGFDADTGWTKGAGWTIAAGVASSDGTQVADSDLSQALTIPGLTYRHQYTADPVTAGNIKAIAGSAEGTDRAVAGTYIETILSAGTTTGVRADLNFIGSVDNVSVKRILESN